MTNNAENILVEDLSCFCSNLTSGKIDTSPLDSMVNTSIAIGTNIYEDEGCEELPIDAFKYTVCPSNLVIRPKYNLEIGQEAPPAMNNILYGFYWFENSNVENPNASDLETDIATYAPGTGDPHYIEDVWSTDGVPIKITSTTYVCYHVIRLPLSIPAIYIKDAAGGVVNDDWEVLTDANYTYYLLKDSIARSAIDYFITEDV